MALRTALGWPSVRGSLGRLTPKCYWALGGTRYVASSSTFQDPAVAAIRPPVGRPLGHIMTHDRPYWRANWEKEDRELPRDQYGVPAQIPPEIATTIKFTYHVPPQYYPFLKKLGDDTPWMKPYCDKLIMGDLTFPEFEEMFYRAAKPLRIYRSRIPKPYRTIEEQSKSEEVMWESAWLSFRQRVNGDYDTHHYFREVALAPWIAFYFAYLWTDAHRQYRIDMKLFYLEAPELKLNWVVPRGDLV
ncbi:unnamed protein product [Vitrella brassicaformis CCMP3155]|uniref:Uncharacterized protein n=1 Tax=Vitrella brassicaformis (strain CCMP3155) TaxID=1169540 RepID=A0A0G4E9N9_VITBC|nr:unnamed protein product [Vitrella brassicaformis CCMP3155]|mmetsp:Transcript_51811/g.130122  ORF Transcript_51811/g.130122 Transcript_51811/m.130122 type:complete len:245 (-) Transcript_51811:1337-2071(-)|eukprot:CEL92361.1 unnamed protein product [Vitrella brassicaformis CCMP3155]